MRYLVRYAWPVMFAVIVLHVCVHAARAQCASGYCTRPAAPVMITPAPAVYAAPAPVLYYQAAPVQAVPYRTVYARPRRFRLFRGCR